MTARPTARSTSRPRSRSTVPIIGWLALSVVAALAGTAGFVLASTQLGQAVYADETPAPAALGLALLAGCLGWCVSVGAGGLAGVELSTRLRRDGLDHALAVDPDKVVTIGAGSAFALAVDAELVGSFLVTSAPAAVLGVTQFAAGSVLSARADQGGVRLLVLAAGTAAMAWAGWRLAVARQGWTDQRVGVSARLVERLIGQRTVALQERPLTEGSEALAEAGAGAALTRYDAAGARMDRTAVAVNATVHVTGVALVLLSVLAYRHGLPAPDVAYALGAAFLVEAGLVSLRIVVEEVTFARVAARGVRRLADLAAAEPPATSPAQAPAVLAAERLTLAYPASPRPVIDDLDLELRAGERVLLTGPSGSGKTTLVEALSGRRTAAAGAVHVAAGAVVVRVPQANDDHILHASLMFNVVAGRAWPPDAAAEDDALAVLDDLGLAPLLARMPAGVLQPVGDGGWRLSAGEQARVRLARALVRRPDVLILDETFAALDAATFDLALAAAQKWATTVLVVAHP